MTRASVASARLVLAVLAVGSVAAQAVLPLAAHEVARAYPEVAHLEVPYAVAGVLGVACAQAVLVLTWRLVSLAAEDAVLTERGLRAVDGVRVALLAGTALVAGVTVHLVGVARTGGPAPVLLLLAGTAVGLALVLLTGIGRGTLRTAVDDHARGARAAAA